MFSFFPYSLILLALAGSLGITLLIVACALPSFKYVHQIEFSFVNSLSIGCVWWFFFSLDFSNWWPLFVVLFYIFSVIPTFISRRYAQNSYSSGQNTWQEVSIFITMGFVISAFALPIVLARSKVVSVSHLFGFFFVFRCTHTHTFIIFHNTQIAPGAAYLTLSGNLVIFATIFVFFVFAENDDGSYGAGF